MIHARPSLEFAQSRTPRSVARETPSTDKPRSSAMASISSALGCSKTRPLLRFRAFLPLRHYANEPNSLGPFVRSGKERRPPAQSASGKHPHWKGSTPRKKVHNVSAFAGSMIFPPSTTVIDRKARVTILTEGRPATASRFARKVKQMPQRGNQKAALWQLVIASRWQS